MSRPETAQDGAAETPLAGKVAYITGAARGQGRQNAIRLARAPGRTSSRSTPAAR